jgi:hypothetical protein
MNKQKVELIIRNMELLIQSLKLEIEETDANLIKLNDIMGSSNNFYESIDDYDPEYYEEK